MREISSIGRTQLGLITTEQVLGRLADHELEYLVRSGQLEPLRRGVYRFAGVPESWEQHVLAACIPAGPDAVASFGSAAALWGLRGSDRSSIEITVPGRRNPRLDAVVVHQSNHWGPEHTSRRSGVPTTSVARTLCDLTARVPPWRIGPMLDDADRRRIVTVRQVERVFRAIATKGRRRSSVMRAVLADRLDGFEAGDSPREVDVAKALVGAGLPLPAAQHRIGVHRKSVHVDFAYPELKIAIEYDGWDTHRTRGAFDDDRARDNDLEIRGWIVLRFTSRWKRSEIVATVRAARDARLVPPDQLTVARDQARRTVNCSEETGGETAGGYATMQSAPRRMRSSA
jgi:putative AbiEi antitoxin of type IV toxin-antitoxin system/uncharacterized protein DUF559